MPGIKKSERRKLKENITPVDWARLAAYIDGEGCITIATNAASKFASHHLKITVVNTDPRLPVWIEKTFGVGRAYAKPKSPSISKEIWRTVYVWGVEASNAAAILDGCLPYFLLKKEQAEIGIAFQSTKGKYPSYGRLALKVPQHVVAQRNDMVTNLKLLKKVEHKLEVA